MTFESSDLLRLGVCLLAVGLYLGTWAVAKFVSAEEPKDSGDPDGRAKGDPKL